MRTQVNDSIERPLKVFLAGELLAVHQPLPVSHYFDDPVAAPCTEPVLKRKEARAATGLQRQVSSPHLKRIVLATDFSAPAEMALRYTEKLAAQLEAELVLVHVIPPIAYSPAHESAQHVREMETKLRAIAKKKMAELVEKTKPVYPVKPVIPPCLLVDDGEAYRGIIQAAREAQADLIVVATHGYTGIKHLLMGSTAERVVRHAPCPVLVVRGQEASFA